MNKFSIKDHILYQNGVKVTQKPSPNRGGTIVPEYIVAHYTASSTATGAISWMQDPKSKVSAHLHIDRDGNVVQLVDLNRAAWHAGKSTWKGRSGLNSFSLGIELQNTSTQEYTVIQIEQTIAVCKAFAEAYPIEEILGHSEIAPGRKQDPGPQFPMQKVRDAVFNSRLEESSDKAISKRTAADLHLRKGPGTNFASLTVLKSGSEVNVLEEKNSWSRVFVCDLRLEGWCSSKYLK